MEILLLDKTLGDNPGTEIRLEFYAERFSQKGHSVRITKTLSELVQPEGLLKYQLAIVHPNFGDARRLKEEVERREDFRIILHSSDPEKYPDINPYISDSGRICSFFSVIPSRLIDFIEQWYKQ